MIIILIKDVWTNFLLSDKYLKNIKSVKRKFTLKTIIDTFEKSESTKKCYKKSYRPSINGKQQSFCNILLNYQFIV